MSTEVTRLTDAQRDTLNTILVPHLSLDSPLTQCGDHQTITDKGTKKTGMSLKETSRASTDDGTIKHGHVVKTTTIATENKTRPVVARKSSERFASKHAPPPSPPDPNSEAKSVCIKRMQARLEIWDDELHRIAKTKKEDDAIIKQELRTRDEQISDLTSKYTSEFELREKTEAERDNLASNLILTQNQLNDTAEKLFHTETQLKQYTQAYQEADTRRNELEEEVGIKTEQLSHSENMRKRLHEQVTELQGLLHIEEQRSRFCTLI